MSLLVVVVLQLTAYVYTLFLRLNGHFPDESGLAGTRTSPFWILLELRVIQVVVTTGAIRRAKLQSNRHHQPTNTQFFYRLDALPVAPLTVSVSKLPKSTENSVIIMV